jgi:hypothetical protein
MKANPLSQRTRDPRCCFQCGDQWSRAAGHRRWAMGMRFTIMVCGVVLMVACHRPNPASSGVTKSNGHGSIQSEPGFPFSPGAARWWEDQIKLGMTESDVQTVVGRRYRSPRPMSRSECLAWSKEQAAFVGNIHKDDSFLNAVEQERSYRIYSRQGIPTTAHQMVVVFSLDPTDCWRVIYRAVRSRPCY